MRGLLRSMFERAFGHYTVCSDCAWQAVQDALAEHGEWEAAQGAALEARAA